MKLFERTRWSRPATAWIGACVAVVASFAPALGVRAGEPQPDQKKEVTSPPAPPPMVEGLIALVPNMRVFDGVLTGGKLSEKAVAELARAGVKTVIDLLMEGEHDFDEKKAVEAAGIAYVHLPVRGAKALGPDLARAFDEALKKADKPVLVHCASGNRVGALFALRAFYVQHKSIEDAIAVGIQHGLTRLKKRVQSLLEEAASKRTKKK